MRAIAQRAEYSAATIYLYFRDKEALLREVIQAGFERMGEYIEAELSAARSASAARRAWRNCIWGIWVFCLE